MNQDFTLIDELIVLLKYYQKQNRTVNTVTNIRERTKRDFARRKHWDTEGLVQKGTAESLAE